MNIVILRKVLKVKNKLKNEKINISRIEIISFLFLILQSFSNMQESDLIKENQKMNEILVMQEEERIMANNLVRYMVDENQQLKSFIFHLEKQLTEKDVRAEHMRDKLFETNLQTASHQQKVHELECQLQEYEGLKANLIASKQKQFNTIAAKRDQSINVKLINLKDLSKSCESLQNFYQINVDNLSIIKNKINTSISKLEMAQEKEGLKRSIKKTDKK